MDIKRDVLSFAMVALVIAQAEAFSEQHGYHYNYLRSGIKPGGKFGSKVKHRYFGNSIRRGTGGFTSGTWKAAALVGAIYGASRYMRTPYYHRYPNQLPPICTNRYERAPNGRVYGHFICPRETEPDSYTWCCGPDQAEFCCHQKYYLRPHRHRRTGPSLFVIIGIIVGVVSFVALAVLCYKRRKVVFSSRKNASNRSTDIGLAQHTNEEDLLSMKYCQYSPGRPPDYDHPSSLGLNHPTPSYQFHQSGQYLQPSPGQYLQPSPGQYSGCSPSYFPQTQPSTYVQSMPSFPQSPSCDQHSVGGHCDSQDTPTKLGLNSAPSVPAHGTSSGLTGPPYPTTFNGGINYLPYPA